MNVSPGGSLTPVARGCEAHKRQQGYKSKGLASPTASECKKVQMDLVIAVKFVVPPFSVLTTHIARTDRQNVPS